MGVGDDVDYVIVCTYFIYVPEGIIYVESGWYHVGLYPSSLQANLRRRRVFLIEVSFTMGFEKIAEVIGLSKY